MKHLKNKTSLKAVVLVVLLAGLSLNAFSYWLGNHTDIVFPVPGKDTVAPAGNYIVTGAGYFIKSYSNTLLFMNKIELSSVDGINYDELNVLLDKALYNIKLAKEAYINLNKLTGSLAYNQSVLDSLKKFDYDSFQAEIDADKDIFNDAREYLYKGDIRGIHSKLLSSSEQIEGVLTRIKEKFNAGVSLPIADIYEVNQIFSRSILFGQYAAQVCGRLKGYN